MCQMLLFRAGNLKITVVPLRMESGTSTKLHTSYSLVSRESRQNRRSLDWIGAADVEQLRRRSKAAKGTWASRTKLTISRATWTITDHWVFGLCIQNARHCYQSFDFRRPAANITLDMSHNTACLGALSCVYSDLLPFALEGTRFFANFSQSLARSVSRAPRRVNIMKNIVGWTVETRRNR